MPNPFDVEAVAASMIEAVYATHRGSTETSFSKEHGGCIILDQGDGSILRLHEDGALSVWSEATHPVRTYMPTTKSGLLERRAGQAVSARLNQWRADDMARHGASPILTWQSQADTAEHLPADLRNRWAEQAQQALKG